VATRLEKTKPQRGREGVITTTTTTTLFKFGNITKDTLGLACS